MTKITFYTKNGYFWGFKETGHTGFADNGDDILCAALSAMTMLILNTIEVAYGCGTDYVIDDTDAAITLKCKSALPEEEPDEKKRFAVEGLFRGYFLQVQDLTEEYYDFLEVEVINEN